jgi:hypothetical protein
VDDDPPTVASGKQPTTSTLSIRLRPDERLRLIEAARVAGTPTAGFAKAAVMSAVARRRLTVHQRHRDQLARQLAMVHAEIIRLVTQLDAEAQHHARAVHADGTPPSVERANPRDAAALRDEVKFLVSAVLGIGRRIEPDVDTTPANTIVKPRSARSRLTAAPPRTALPCMPTFGRRRDRFPCSSRWRTSRRRPPIRRYRSCNCSGVRHGPRSASGTS